MVEEFLNVLANANIANQGEDHWLWLEDSSSMDSVKSTYTALYDLRVGSNEINIFKSLW